MGGLIALIVTSLLFTASASAEDSSTEPKVETATFSMYCYWTGEATLGQVDGVVASRIGHWGGKEIVQVDYDPRRTGVGDLIAALKKQRSFDSLLVPDAAEHEQASGQVERGDVSVEGGKPRFIEPKHSLRTRHPELADLDLTEEQAIALNSWSYFGGPMPDVLTEEQRRRLSER